MGGGGGSQMTPTHRRVAQLGSLLALVVLWDVRPCGLGWADPLFVPAPVGGGCGRSEDDRRRRRSASSARRSGRRSSPTSLVRRTRRDGAGLRDRLGVRYPVRCREPVPGRGCTRCPKILVLPWILLAFGLGAATPAVVYGDAPGLLPDLSPRDRRRRTRPRPDADHASLARWGRPTGQLYRKVILPAVLPAVLAGMRLGIVFCLLGVLVVEMFGGIRGMGFLLVSLANAFRAPELFAATGLVSLLSVGIVLGLERLNRRLGPLALRRAPASRPGACGRPRGCGQGSAAASRRGASVNSAGGGGRPSARAASGPCTRGA